MLPQAEIKANKAVEKAATKEAKYLKGRTRAEEKHNNAITALNKAKQALQVRDFLCPPLPPPPFPNSPPPDFISALPYALPLSPLAPNIQLTKLTTQAKTEEHRKLVAARDSKAQELQQATAAKEAHDVRSLPLPLIVSTS